MVRSRQRRILQPILMGCALSGLVLLTGCSREGRFVPVSMWNGSRLKPMEPSPMPGEASSSRLLPIGTVARGQLNWSEPAYTGRDATGALLTKVPFQVTPEVLKRGQDRFTVYCSPCHGLTGDGEGMIVQRGFPPPPDYAIPRLRNAPIGHFFDVMTNGYGVMYSYASRVDPHDRWAIAAYIRVLQAQRPVVPERRNQQLRREGPGGGGPITLPDKLKNRPPTSESYTPGLLEGGNSTSSQSVLEQPQSGD